MVSFMKYMVYFIKFLVCCSIAVLDPPAWYAKADMPWVKGVGIRHPALHYCRNSIVYCMKSMVYYMK